MEGKDVRGIDLHGVGQSLEVAVVDLDFRRAVEVVRKVVVLELVAVFDLIALARNRDNRREYLLALR